MEISGNDSSVNLGAYVKSVKAGKEVEVGPREAEKKVDKGIAGEDKVVLSPKAREIQKAKMLLASVPDVREEKVQEIRQRIEEGTYKVESKKIAEKIVKESLLNELA
ncbi:MAG: flagellar biosynthesis anti-sigma factor FlgM [Desulfatiglans sp.]|jgi:negative regulator of flagellin synthesis FlgM|nr:flagellar biosynthesis anti-sigma factor FlgM [Thermodesulfobacteriota bacterium]MEE4354443.1 flagellar biosynthesis anti-sigma factor FlgM [Desulfatiglans sp.]